MKDNRIFEHKRSDFPTLCNDYLKGESKTVTFIVTHDCTLRCTYCYEHHKSNKKMSIETGKKIVDLLFEEEVNNSELINNKNSEYIILDFIGGEPLLEIDLIDNIVDYFRYKAFKLNHRWLYNYMINISTNGTQYFDEKVQKFLQKNKGKVSLCITLDGNKQLHDSCRLFPDGTPSYDIVSKAVRDFSEKYHMWDSKVTLSKENIPYFYDAVKCMLEEFNFYEIYANCAYEPEYNEDDALILYQQLKKISDYLIDNNKWQTFFLSILYEDVGYELDLNTKDGNRNWCGGNGNMLAFDVDGTIYPCIRYAPLSIGKTNVFTLGNLNGGLIKTKESIANIEYLKKITYKSQSDKKCLECSIKGGCGWCTAYNCEATGDPNKRVTNICIMHQARVLAHYYFYNKICNLIDRKEDKLKIRIPEDWAINIIGKEEFEMIKNL